MKKIVLRFGLLAGAVLIAGSAITIPLCLNGTLPFEQSLLIGYSIMVLSFLMVFAGIRRYRENAGGTITFGKAFQVGILISLIASVMYVAAWEIVYYGFVPDFEDRYAAKTIEGLRKEGASAEKIAETEREMAEFKKLYKNPLINIGMTFMEVLPVALIMTLVSAAILRKREPEGPVVSPA